MTSNSMPVSVSLTVTVDREDWDHYYGSGTRAADVREDVRRYILNLVQSSAAANDGGITSVAVRASDYRPARLGS